MSPSTLTTPPAILSITPITIPAPARPVDLRLRVTAPVTGTGLPIVLLSHGLGPSNHLSSLDGYAPLAQHLAASGFAVVQPTHLDSRTLHHLPDEVRATAWRSRAEDMRHILDHLDTVVPQLAGRLDRAKIAVAGHSMGGHTASLLLGMRVTDPRDGTRPHLADPRVKAGVVLAAPGSGGHDGDALTEFVRENYPFLSTGDFSGMATPALVVVGDADASTHLTTRGPDWHAEPYRHAPGPKSLLTLYGAEHGLGGVSGFDVAETTDENPERAATVMRLVAAYLRSALDPSDPAWPDACAELAASDSPQGRVESK